MKKVNISKSNIKDYLAEKLAKSLLQTEENEVINYIRNEGIAGFGNMSDKELFDHLVSSLPEFELMDFISSDENQMILSVKEEYKKGEEDILVDITRIIQMKL